jgi:dUTP pyrophosphatase
MTDKDYFVTKVTIKFRGPNAPAYQTAGAAGCDIIADEDKEVRAHGQALISTGLFLEIPPGYEGQVRSRSGLAAKHGISVLNSPGTIDSDYRGEVKVILRNSSNTHFYVRKGDRIAQLVIAPVIQAVFEGSEELSLTDRGQGGFGSTGRQ